jgi:hypothetical protein
MSCWGRRRCRVPWCDAMAVRVSYRYLDLNINQLSGSIPSTLGSLAALRCVVRKPCACAAALQCTTLLHHIGRLLACDAVCVCGTMMLRRVGPVAS